MRAQSDGGSGAASRVQQMTAISPKLAVGAVKAADVVVGPHAPEALLLATMRRARGDVFQELHTIGVAAEDALLEAIEGGARQHILAGRRVSLPGWSGNAERLAAAQQRGLLQVTRYAGDDAARGTTYQHSKLFAATRTVDGDEPIAIFSNVSPFEGSAARPDIAVTLRGRPAEAVQEVLAASMGEHGRAGVEQLEQAIRRAAEAGVLVDDAHSSITPLADTMREMVRSARHRIVHISKGVDDPAFASALVDARRAGVAVGLSERDIARSSGALLHRGGVPTVLHPSSTNGSRLNVLIVDDRALVSTSYAWEPMLGLPRAGAVRSRESGIVLEGAALAQLEAALQSRPEGRAAFELAARGDVPRSAAASAPSAWPPAGGVWDARRSVRELDRGLEPGFRTLEDALAGNRLLEQLS